MEDTVRPCIHNVNGKVIQLKTLPGLAFKMLTESDSMEDTTRSCIRNVDGRVIRCKTLPSLAFLVLMEG